MTAYTAEHNPNGKFFRQAQVVRTNADGSREVVWTGMSSGAADGWAARYNAGEKPYYDMTEEERTACEEADDAEQAAAGAALPERVKRELNHDYRK